MIDDAHKARKPHVAGMVVGHNDSNGLVYDVRHKDSQEETGYIIAHYDPTEIEVVERSFTTTVNTAIDHIIPKTETALIECLTRIRDTAKNRHANPWIEAADILMFGAHPSKGSWTANLAAYWGRP